MLRTCLMIWLAIVLAGCSTGNLTAINQKRSLGPSDTNSYGTFIDAKQRTILAAERPARGTDPKRLIVCAEPSPDALAAVAASAGVSVSQLSQAIAAQGAMSETAANIGLRTQTIQILRDGYYRLCEAQMNGLDDVQYAMLLRRFQTNMIALLAIEQLTGAVRGGDALVAASAGMPLNFSEMYTQRAILAAQEISDINKRLPVVATAITKLAADIKSCEGKSDSAGCSGDDVLRMQSEMSVLEDEKKSLEEREVQAKFVKEQNDVLASKAPSASAGQVSGAILSSISAASSAQHVSSAVAEITKAVIEQDHGTQICLEYLRDGLSQTAPVRDLCEKVVSSYADVLSARAKQRHLATSFATKILDTILSDGKIAKDETALLELLLTGRMGAQTSALEHQLLSPVVATPFSWRDIFLSETRAQFDQGVYAIAKPNFFDPH